MALPFVHPRLQEALAPHLPDTGQIWRDPDTTTAAPHANADDFGFEVTSNAPAPAPQTGVRKVAEYPCQVAPAEKGKEVVTLGQDKAVAPWWITFFASQYTDCRSGDQIRIGARTFSVVSPGGADSFGPFRIVYCQEVSS